MDKRYFKSIEGITMLKIMKTLNNALLMHSKFDITPIAKLLLAE